MLRSYGQAQGALQLYTSQKIKVSYNNCSPVIIQKIEKFGKSFDNLTKDTGKGFLIDSKKIEI